MELFLCKKPDGKLPNQKALFEFSMFKVVSPCEVDGNTTFMPVYKLSPVQDAALDAHFQGTCLKYGRELTLIARKVRQNMQIISSKMSHNPWRVYCGNKMRF